MKHLYAMLLTIVLLISIFTGCSSNKASQDPQALAEQAIEALFAFNADQLMKLSFPDGSGTNTSAYSSLSGYYAQSISILRENDFKLIKHVFISKSVIQENDDAYQLLNMYELSSVDLSKCTVELYHFNLTLTQGGGGQYTNESWVYLVNENGQWRLLYLPTGV